MGVAAWRASQAARPEAAWRYRLCKFPRCVWRNGDRRTACAERVQGRLLLLSLEGGRCGRDAARAGNQGRQWRVTLGVAPQRAPSSSASRRWQPHAPHQPRVVPQPCLFPSTKLPSSPPYQPRLPPLRPRQQTGHACYSGLPLSLHRRRHLLLSRALARARCPAEGEGSKQERVVVVVVGGAWRMATYPPPPLPIANALQFDNLLSESLASGNFTSEQATIIVSLLDSRDAVGGAFSHKHRTMCWSGPSHHSCTLAAIPKHSNTTPTPIPSYHRSSAWLAARTGTLWAACTLPRRW